VVISMQKVLWAMAGCLGLMGCAGDGDSTTNSEGQGQVQISVTDAPVDFASAVVLSFSAVELFQNGEVVETLLLETPQSIDLLQLQGAHSRTLLNQSVAEGSYDELRFKVDTEAPSCQQPSAEPASYVIDTQGKYPLVIPSGDFKVKGPLVVAADRSVAYTVDFDLRKSIKRPGRGEGCFKIKPVLHLTDDSQSGSLMGVVSNTLLTSGGCTNDGKAAIYLYSGADAVVDDLGSAHEPLHSVQVQQDNGNYTYAFGFIPAGQYTVAFSCTSSVDQPDVDDAIGFSTPINVTLQAAQTTQQNFTVSVP